MPSFNFFYPTTGQFAGGKSAIFCSPTVWHSWDETLKSTYIHLYMCSWYKNCCRHHFHSNHRHQSHKPFCCLHHHKMCPQSIVFLHHFLEEKRLSDKFLVGWNHSISKGTSRISSSKCGRADPRRLHTQHGSFNLQLNTV